MTGNDKDDKKAMRPAACLAGEQVSAIIMSVLFTGADLERLFPDHRGGNEQP